ncbi:hypothetical protein [Spirosoma fluviale]|uniref:hypothetical protein n=1 Tax=Spirosoma fluviale TaxID=1597977 RepID=UPI0011817B67|nr:hypothetical protein [Spirosoma fluviale]
MHLSGVVRQNTVVVGLGLACGTCCLSPESYPTRSGQRRTEPIFTPAGEAQQRTSAALSNLPCRVVQPVDRNPTWLVKVPPIRRSFCRPKPAE